MVELLEADFDPDDSINALVENGMTRLMGGDGIGYEGIYFTKDEKGFVLILKATSYDKYQEWLKICPPPQGIRAAHKALLTLGMYGCYKRGTKKKSPILSAFLL